MNIGATSPISPRCLKKDALSLKHQLAQKGCDISIIDAIVNANEYQLEHFLDRAEETGFDFHDKQVALIGTAFKRKSNDVRNSAALGLTKRLLGSGVRSIKAFDPAGTEMYRKFVDPGQNELFAKITYCATLREALYGTDASIITTDWPQFREIGNLIIECVKPPHLLMDGRRMLTSDYQRLIERGFDVLAVGSPFSKAK